MAHSVGPQNISQQRGAPEGAVKSSLKRYCLFSQRQRNKARFDRVQKAVKNKRLTWALLAQCIENALVEELWQGHNPFDTSHHSNNELLNLWVLAREKAPLSKADKGELKQPLKDCGLEDFETYAKAVLRFQVQACIDGRVNAAASQAKAFYSCCQEVSQHQRDTTLVATAETNYQHTEALHTQEPGVDNLTPRIKKHFVRAMKQFKVSAVGKQMKTRRSELSQTLNQIQANMTAENILHAGNGRLTWRGFRPGWTHRPRGVQQAANMLKKTHSVPGVAAMKLLLVFCQRLGKASHTYRSRKDELVEFYRGSVHAILMRLLAPGGDAFFKDLQDKPLRAVLLNLPVESMQAILSDSGLNLGVAKTILSVLPVEKVRAILSGFSVEEMVPILSTLHVKTVQNILSGLSAEKGAAILSSLGVGKGRPLNDALFEAMLDQDAKVKGQDGKVQSLPSLRGGTMG